ncbi:hypothetical protein NG819_07905 [Pseudarthrobacter sp. Fe7]|nr:hypothetical protein NG819_07905 [Pseudarthrobacter sp. Fe7]
MTACVSSLDTGALLIHPAKEEIFVEIAELSGFPDGRWMAWRPGEDTFEDLVKRRSWRFKAGDAVAAMAAMTDHIEGIRSRSLSLTKFAQQG